jgi:hypothetical protein
MIPIHHPPIDYEGILEKMNLKLFQGSLYRQKPETVAQCPTLDQHPPQLASRSHSQSHSQSYSQSRPTPLPQQGPRQPDVPPALKGSYIYQKYFKNDTKVPTKEEYIQWKQDFEKNRKRNFLQNQEKRKLLISVESGSAPLAKSTNTFFKMR